MTEDRNPSSTNSIEHTESPIEIEGVDIKDIKGEAQVAVGTNIAQTRIGQIVVNIVRSPWQRALVSLSILILFSITGIYYVLLKSPKPTEMKSEFNVAVAGFYSIDEKGNYIAKEDGINLANYLYQRLETSFTEFDLNSVNYEIWPPELTGIIRGSNHKERYAAAEKLAREINAHVVIYGVIQYKDSQGSFSPEFYVSHYAFEQAEDMVGEYKLGRQLVVQSPFDITNQNPALAARSEALSLITLGLAYYSIDDYDNALKFLGQATSLEKWLRNAGQEIAYVLLGNAAKRKASVDKEPTEFIKAYNYYTVALEINPQLARAKLGQAAILYLRALGDLNDSSFDSIDESLLDKAEVTYEVALTLKDQPLGASIEEKYHFGLGDIFFVRFKISKLSEWLIKARIEYQIVTDAFESGNEHLREIASYAYARLALIEYDQNDKVKAIAEYKKAIELASPFFKAQYSASLGEVYVGVPDIALAIEEYKNAVALSESLGDSNSAEKFTNRLNELLAKN